MTRHTTEFVLEERDCIEAMSALAPDSVDVVVTSPPYNLGIKYKTYEDSKTRKEYLDWSRRWADEVKRVLKPAGSFFLNLGASPSDPLIPHELVILLDHSGFVLQNTFHWIKSITIRTKEGEEISAGHFKPLQSKRYVNDCHEFVFHLTREGTTLVDRLSLGVAYSDKSNIARWSHTKGQDKRCRGNNWFIPYKTIVNRSKERPHPATFPVELAENCIRIHGCRTDLVVLDPFVGIGHSAVAAKNCQVAKFIGYDIDAEYLAVAHQVVGSQIPSAPPKAKAKPGRPCRRSKHSEFDLFDEG